MKRLVIVLTALAAASAACKPPTDDAEALAAAVRRSGVTSRTFVYKLQAVDRAFTVRGEVADDLRYRLVLEDAAGVPLIEQVVVDDALAVRFPSGVPPQFGTGPLGAPPVDQALRSGGWALNPAGAPPLLKAGSSDQQDPAALPDDPLIAATDEMRYLTLVTSQAAGVREFNFEAIDYRPQDDPFKYVSSSSGLVRLDLFRPFLPRKQEDLTGPGAPGDVSTAHFRRLSAFLRNGRISEVCEYVDVSSHEEFRRAEQRGGNRFLEELKERVLRGDTQTPIVLREVYFTLRYPKDVTVELPQGAVGSLSAYQGAYAVALENGLVAPAAPVSSPKLADCRRTSDEPPS